MIVGRLVDGIRSHFPVRVSEWHMLYPAALVGGLLHWQSELFTTSVAYNNVAAWMDQQWWAVLFLACAVMRLGALVVNGTFEGFTHSPTVRLIVSVISSLVWGQFCLGFFLEWLDTGKAAILTVALSHLVLIENVNAFRSARDMAARSVAHG